MGTEAATLTDLSVAKKQDGEENIVNPLGSKVNIAEIPPRKRYDIDGGWAWMALLSSFIIHSIIFGAMMGMGLFYSEFLDEFHQGPVMTSWLIATNCALGALLGPVGSILANRFGFRLVIMTGTIIASTGYILSYFVDSFWTLFLTFGIMTGIGSGMVYSPSFGILALYFDKRKTLATSAATVGIGIGMFLIPPAQRALIATTTWRGAALITGGLTLNIIPCAAIFSHHIRSTTSTTWSQYADVSLFRKISFYIVCTHFFLMAGFNIFLISTIRYAVEHVGVAFDDAPTMLSVQGIANICGRLTAVAVSSSSWTSGRGFRYTTLQLTSVIGALSIVFYPFCDSFYTLCVCTGCAGFGLGCRWALLPGLQMDVFTADRFSTSWAYGMFLLGIGSLIMPPLGEWIAKMNGQEESPFVFGGSSILLATACTLVIQVCAPSRRIKLRYPGFQKSALPDLISSK